MKTFRWTFPDPPLSSVEQDAAKVSLRERERRLAEARRSREQQKDEKFLKWWSRRRERGMLKALLIDIGWTSSAAGVTSLFLAWLYHDPGQRATSVVIGFALVMGGGILGLLIGFRHHWKQNERRFQELIESREPASPD